MKLTIQLIALLTLLGCSKKEDPKQSTLLLSSKIPDIEACDFEQERTGDIQLVYERLTDSHRLLNITLKETGQYKVTEKGGTSEETHLLKRNSLMNERFIKIKIRTDTTHLIATKDNWTHTFIIKED